MQTTETYLSVKQTAAAMRKELRGTYPGTRFSVRMSPGTGHGWIDVAWEDGPTTDQVDEVLDPFQSSAFDGMSDTYRAREQTGPIRYSCCGVLTSRRMSLAAARTVAEVVNGQVQGRPAVAVGASVTGPELSEQDGQRLDVHAVGGCGAVDMDLVAHQIFQRTTFTPQ